ncbi:hypothetical protein [Myroides odoratus]|uniref:hypothetical protein n=1 Tax=Myroides odoratus TaxID=256 RepID=UPI0011C048F9|nr:hypothetical protein [Myroides odoratus]
MKWLKNMEGEWQIESVDSFYYRCNRFYSYMYKEVTYWFNPKTLERKETERSVCIEVGERHKLPTWSSRCVHRKGLDHN